MAPPPVIDLRDEEGCKGIKKPSWSCLLPGSFADDLTTVGKEVELVDGSIISTQASRQKQTCGAKKRKDVPVFWQQNAWQDERVTHGLVDKCAVDYLKQLEWDGAWHQKCSEVVGYVESHGWQTIDFGSFGALAKASLGEIKKRGKKCMSKFPNEEMMDDGSIISYRSNVVQADAVPLCPVQHVGGHQRQPKWEKSSYHADVSVFWQKMRGRMSMDDPYPSQQEAAAFLPVMTLTSQKLL